MDLKGDVLIRIRDMIPRMSKSQKKIAFYIQNEYETAVFMTAAELGKQIGVSESTIVRFASALDQAFLKIRVSVISECRSKSDYR